MVFFCWACATPAAMANAAAVASSGTINFFIAPFMCTSLWSPHIGAVQRFLRLILFTQRRNVAEPNTQFRMYLQLLQA
jgi:hypothetical protein